MTSIVMLAPDERVIRHIDPDLCEIKETIKSNGLRTINLEYYFQKYDEDKELFKLGNKLWIQNDINLTDCLYVVNTKVKQDIFKDNCFTLELEEVLVELNNAPLTSHLDLSSHSGVFKTRTINNATEVKIDWNCLNYWFGDFYNIGVLQDCLNSSVQWIPFFGTYNKMQLLRFIEEQTGNVFVTRYEKDLLNNTIHRYLDFLNPINVSKDWEYHIEYDLKDTPRSITYYDYGITEAPADKAWEIVRYLNSRIDPESMTEQVLDPPYNADRDEALAQYDALDQNYQWVAEDEMWTDEGTIKHYDTIANINPANIQFQITNHNFEVLTADGTVYEEGDTNALVWLPSDLNYTSEKKSVLITLAMNNRNTLGLAINNKTFAAQGEDHPEYSGMIVDKYVPYTDKISETVASENERDNCIIPDDCYFEMYDTVNSKVLFRTCINRSIGHVHEEVLDFGFNLDNIQYDIDESDVYTAIAPLLSYNDKDNQSTAMTRANFNNLVTRFKNLSVNKGDRIPMIMQKITVQNATLIGAKESLGGYIVGQDKDESNSPSNYWIRPYKPNDNEQTGESASQSTWEFLRATAYWNAPFTKKAGSLNVVLDETQGIEYPFVFGRGDTRANKGMFTYNKVGTTESSDEDVYSIYNQCALYLKEHCTPKIELDVDVSNLKNGKYNDYDLHDKVYIKIPETNQLITARVIETTKKSHDISANTIKLSNYTTTNTIKVQTQNTIIRAVNTSYKYPNSKTLSARLENLDYNSEDYYSVQYPANKLLSFTLYEVKDGQRRFIKYYTKITNAYGYAYLPMKYWPGQYEIDIQFAGDEEYTETTFTVKISVGGVRQTKKATNNNKSKTTKKTTKKVTKTTYYDKYGRSPDKKKILAIGKISASGDQGSYADYYGMEFKNKCPHCGHETLVWGIFWAGENTSYGYFDGTKASEGGSIEGHIFCTHCDADYSCQGNEHVYGGKKLTSTKNRFKSSKNDAYLLKKGKYVYEKATTTVTTNKNSNTKNRKILASNLSSKVKNLALSIVGEKTGYKAMRAICDWMDHNISYSGYGDFQKSPDSVISSRCGNCCDQTRLILQLFDAAGLTEYYDMYYVHVHEYQGHVYGMIKAKNTGKSVYIDPASDSFGCYGYVCQGYSRGSPASKYPNRPF